MTDLHSRYLGLQLRSPLVASAGPFTGDLEKVRELEAAGAGAIVLPSLFEEQIEHETSEVDRLFGLHHDSFGEATSLLPDVDGFVGAADAYLNRVEQVKQRIDIPVIASLNGTNIGGWLRYARLLEDAGADAIELNLYTVAADPDLDASTLESEQIELVDLLTDEVGVPVAVKISPFYTSLSHFLVQLQAAGAAGVVMFNRFYAPDLDTETLDIKPRISLSSQAELRLPLRWIGIAREFLDISIAGSTGVHTGRDAAKLILAGADVAMTTSSLLFNGVGHLSTIESELVNWMRSHEYTSVQQMRGAVSRDSTPDPAAYERAAYIGNLTSYTSRFLGGTPLGLRHP